MTDSVFSMTNPPPHAGVDHHENFSAMMAHGDTVVASTGEDDDFRACRKALGQAQRSFQLAKENLRLAGVYSDMGNARLQEHYADRAYDALQELSYDLDYLLGHCADIGALSQSEIDTLRDIKERVDGLLRKYAGDGPGLGERAGEFLEQAGDLLASILIGLIWLLGALGRALLGNPRPAF